MSENKGEISLEIIKSFPAVGGSLKISGSNVDMVLEGYLAACNTIIGSGPSIPVIPEGELSQDQIGEIMDSIMNYLRGKGMTGNN